MNGNITVNQLLMFQGSTKTSYTGPSSSADGTYYKYIEVSDLLNGARAILTTDATNLQGIFISTLLECKAISPVMTFISNVCLQNKGITRRRLLPGLIVYTCQN